MGNGSVAFFRINGKSICNLVSHVVSLNLTRRHLSESQRGMVAARLANMKHGGDRGNQHTGAKASIDAMPQKKAAELLNVSEPTVERAHRVLEHGAPELAQAVDEGKLKVSTAPVFVQGKR